METSDSRYWTHIRHQPDWNGYAVVTWTFKGANGRQILPAAALALGDVDVLLRAMPAPVALVAVSIASAARAKYEAGLVLSRPPNRAPTADEQTHKMTANDVGFLFHTDLVNEASSEHGSPRPPRRLVPLGWIENQPLEVSHNGTESVLIDIGTRAEFEPLNGRPMADIGRIGRLAVADTYARMLAEQLLGALNDPKPTSWSEPPHRRAVYP